MTDISRRLEALERRMNAERPSGTLPAGVEFSIVCVEGGLPPGDPLFAMAGGHEWFREPGEDLLAFAERTARAALALKETALMIGGLPATDRQQDVAMAAYEAWLLTDDGVPPVTSPRYARR
jgi:hypothetical protein